MRIFRNDTAPDLVVTCYDGDTVVDLTSAASIRVIGKMGTTVIVDSTDVVNGGSDGSVTYSWASADTAMAGRLYIEVEVHFAGGVVQTFRPDDVVDIVPDLG